MNVLKGQLRGNGFALNDRIVLPCSSIPASRVGEEMLYGVRPEHFMFDDDGFEAKVEVVEPTGSETQVMASVGGQAITAVFRERVSAQPGDIIRVSVQSQSVHLFDPNNGIRLMG